MCRRTYWYDNESALQVYLVIFVTAVLAVTVVNHYVSKYMHFLSSHTSSIIRTVFPATLLLLFIFSEYSEHRTFCEETILSEKRCLWKLQSTG